MLTAKKCHGRACSRARLCGSCYLQMATPPPFLEDIHACGKIHHVITMFAVVACGADLFVCKWRGLPLYQLPFFKAINACTKAQASCPESPCLKNHVITMMMMWIILLANGGGCPFFEAIHAFNKKIKSPPCLQWGKVARILFGANGGPAPPQPPRLVEAITAYSIY